LTKREENNKKLIRETIAEYIEQQGRKKSKAYHNTKLLMKNYSTLKQHSKNAVYELKEDVEGFEFNMDFDEPYIQSILKSKIRTAIMLQHIDMALDMLKRNSAARGKSESDKYNILVGVYITGDTYDDLAERYNCVTSTVWRWENDMLRELSVLLFGVDGLLTAR